MWLMRTNKPPQMSVTDSPERSARPMRYGRFMQPAASGKQGPGEEHTLRVGSRRRIIHSPEKPTTKGAARTASSRGESCNILLYRGGGGARHAPFLSPEICKAGEVAHSWRNKALTSVGASFRLNTILYNFQRLFFVLKIFYFNPFIFFQIFIMLKKMFCRR